MELTPRTLGDEAPATGPARRRRWLPLAVLGVVLAVAGFLVLRGLSDATLYFRNADEAVAQRDSLGTRRFRLQGTVVAEPERDGDTVRFDVAYNGVEVPVSHAGDPPDLFRPGIPVVLEGHFAAQGSDVFESDRILVKHDEEYESRDDYDMRLDQADEGGETNGDAGGGAGSGGGEAGR